MFPCPLNSDKNTDPNQKVTAGPWNSFSLSPHVILLYVKALSMIAMKCLHENLLGSFPSVYILPSAVNSS